MPAADEPSSPAEAAEDALRALAARERSVAELDRRLAAGGYDADERGRALAGLVRSGLVDDVRYARARADALARRGAGDALVRFELHRAGIADDLVEDALAALPPEAERAERIAARRGRGARTARYLQAKGFSDDVVSAIAGETASGLG